MYLSYICIPFITFFLKQVVFEAFYIMYTINGSYKVRQCSTCAGDTEYSCLSCPSDLCAECRENHIHDLDTIDHNVVIYRGKYTKTRPGMKFVQNILTMTMKCTVNLVNYLSAFIAQNIEHISGRIFKESIK